MDNKRLHKKNQLVDEIKQIDLTMSRDISSIDKLKHSRMDIAFVQNSITKINIKVEEKKLRKKQLQEDLVKLDQGDLDDDIQSEYNKSKLLINQKNEEHKNKRAVIAKQKADDEEKTTAINQHNRQVNNNIKQQHRDIKYEEKRFFKMVETIPIYIDKNLDDMPNNKGYIWRGILLFGKQHTIINKNEPLLVFDKQNKDNLLIHEWSETDYSLYKKIGKNPKTTISTKPRHIIKDLPNFIQNEPTPIQESKPVNQPHRGNPQSYRGKTQPRPQSHQPRTQAPQTHQPRPQAPQTHQQPRPQTHQQPRTQAPQTHQQPRTQAPQTQSHQPPRTQSHPRTQTRQQTHTQTSGEQTQSEDKKQQNNGGKSRGGIDRGRGGGRGRGRGRGRGGGNQNMPSLLKPEKNLN